MSIQKPSIAVVSEIDPDAAMVTLVNQSANSKVELECVKADDSDLELLLRAVYEQNASTTMDPNSSDKSSSLFYNRPESNPDRLPQEIHKETPSLKPYTKLWGPSFEL